MAQIEQAPIGMSYPEAGGKLGATMASRRMVSDVRFRELEKTPTAPYRPYIPSPLEQLAEAAVSVGNSVAKTMTKIKEQKSETDYLDAYSQAKKARELQDLKQKRGMIEAIHSADQYTGEAEQSND